MSNAYTGQPLFSRQNNTKKTFRQNEKPRLLDKTIETAVCIMYPHVRRQSEFGQSGKQNSVKYRIISGPMVKF